MRRQVVSWASRQVRAGLAQVSRLAQAKPGVHRASTQAKRAPPTERYPPKGLISKGTPHATPGSRLEQLMQHPLLFDPVRAPRHPVVLCHGLYGFDVRGPFLGLEYQYWSAALDVLRKRAGATVYVYGVPPTGSIKERAESLHAFLTRPGSEVLGKKLNFVGHSMGGLDARYLISHIRPREYTPVTLTSLVTPHRGSPFMDWCNSNIGVGLELVDELTRDLRPETQSKPLPYSLKAPLFARTRSAPAELESTTMGKLSRVLTSLSSTLSHYILSVFDQPAYAMLSTQYMTKLFNPRTPDDPRVRYYSIAARVREMSVLHPLWLPKLILDKAADAGTNGGEADGSSEARGGALRGNDGLVSVGSACWGEYLGAVENWDHWDMRGPGGTARIRPAGDASNSRHAASSDGATQPTTASLPMRPASPPLHWPTAALSSFRKWWRSKSPAPAPADEWDWRDAVLSPYNEGEFRAERGDRTDELPVPAAAYALSSVMDKKAHPAHEDEIAKRLADWIASHLPRAQNASSDAQSDDSELLLMYLSQPVERRGFGAHAPYAESESRIDAWDALGNAETAAKLRAQLGSSPQAERLSAMLRMFPFLMNSGQDGAVSPSADAFERFWLAVLRNLYEEGF